MHREGLYNDNGWKMKLLHHDIVYPAKYFRTTAADPVYARPANLCECLRLLCCTGARRSRSGVKT